MSGQLKRFIHWHALDWAFQIVISLLLARQHLCFFSWLAHPAKNLYQIHFNLNSTKRVQANHKPLFFYLTDDLHFSHTHKKSQDLEFLPILLNCCVRWNHQSIEKWSVRDFSMEFLRFLFVFKFLCCLNFFWKKKLLLEWWWRGFWGEAKCSLYGCQQVVNRKLLKEAFTS